VCSCREQEGEGREGRDGYYEKKKAPTHQPLVRHIPLSGEGGKCPMWITETKKEKGGKKKKLWGGEFDASQLASPSLKGKKEKGERAKRGDATNLKYP